MKALRISSWVLFVFFAIAVGGYPAMYFVSDMIAENGLLSQKAANVIAMRFWQISFNTHIIFGGLALLIGWVQFMPKFRNRNLKLHRLVGMLYILAIVLSGLAGLYLAFYAEGGLVAKLGFGGLAIGWLYTTGRAFVSIKKRNIEAHKRWMIRSYALTFAAVTLRIWLPLFQYAIGMDFITAYVIIAWLCWVPNLAWAEWKVRRLAG